MLLAGRSRRARSSATPMVPGIAALVANVLAISRGAIFMDGDIAEDLPPLIDLTQVSLDRLLTLDNPVLTASVHRILAEIDNPSEVIAGFQSSIDAISRWPRLD